MVATTVLSETDLPTRQSHRFGLKAVATEALANNRDLIAPLEWQESCGTNVRVAPDNCDPLLEPEDRVKQPFALDDGAGLTPFALYALHECSAIGNSLPERQGFAMDELDLGEWHQIERTLATVITAGTAISAPVAGAKAALARILMAWDMPVEPTVHVTPNVAVALEGQYEKAMSGQRLDLKVTGSPFAVGFGYDVGLAADEGWIMLTGPVFVRRGQAMASEPTLNMAANSVLALAERPYSIGYRCGAIFVKVTAVSANL